MIICSRAGGETRVRGFVSTCLAGRRQSSVDLPPCTASAVRGPRCCQPALGARLVQTQQGGIHQVAAVLQRGQLAQLHQLVDGGRGQVALAQLPAAMGG